MFIIHNTTDHTLSYKTPYSVGFDIPTNVELTILPNETLLAPTGLWIEVPEKELYIPYYTTKPLTPSFITVSPALFVGHPSYIKVIPELQIRPKSGLALKMKLRIGNAPGTIDPDYEDNNFIASVAEPEEKYEVRVIMHNFSEDVIHIPKGKAIAQGIVCLTTDALNIERLGDVRKGGFGSTNETT